MNDKFEDLYSKLEKIVDLMDKVPADKRNKVFDELFDAAKESAGKNLYTAEIEMLSEINPQSLKDFIAEHKPNSNIERSVLFVAYMEDLGIQDITAKHIAACYNMCSFNEPGNLSQNLRDAASSRYRYLEVDQNRFHTTQRGKEFCKL